MAAIPEDFPNWRLRCVCERCGHEWASRWHPRGEFITVLICPKCKSRRWNDPRPPGVRDFDCPDCGRITVAHRDVALLYCRGCGRTLRPEPDQPGDQGEADAADDARTQADDHRRTPGGDY